MTIIQKGEPMSDLISRQAAIETVKKHYRGIDNDLLEIIAYEMEELPPTQPSATDTNVDGNLISRQAALDVMETWDKFGCDPDGKLVRYDDDKHYIPYVHYEDMVHAIKHLPSAQLNLSEAYSKAVFTWLRDYQIRAAELKGRYTPYEVLSWVANDWRKEHERSD